MSKNDDNNNNNNIIGNSIDHKRPQQQKKSTNKKKNAEVETGIKSIILEEEATKVVQKMSLNNFYIFYCWISTSSSASRWIRLGLTVSLQIVLRSKAHNKYRKKKSAVLWLLKDELKVVKRQPNVWFRTKHIYFSFYSSYNHLKSRIFTPLFLLFFHYEYIYTCLSIFSLRPIIEDNQQTWIQARQAECCCNCRMKKRETKFWIPVLMQLE